MARQLRIEYAGAVYHVMARGNQGRPIVADDLDRRTWLNALSQACLKTGWRIHAWVLMPNHYHLLVETPEANLVVGMKWLQGTYTQRYNSRHATYGHLFQGRYKALVVDGEAGNYFGVVSTYIHLNPARAHLVRAGGVGLAGYPWSSYPWYLKVRRQRPGWLVTERVLGNLGLGPEDRRGYAAYLEGRRLELEIKAGRSELEADWKRIRRGWYLGGDGFRGRMLKNIKATLAQRRLASYMGPAKQAHGEAEAKKLLGLGLTILGLKAGELAGRPKSAPEKQLLAWWLHGRTTMGRRWISAQLGMGEESVVSRAVRYVAACPDSKIEGLKEQLVAGAMSES